MSVRFAFVVGAALGVLLSVTPVAQSEWHVALSDNGSGNWADYWFLSGDPARGITVTNSPAGMTLRAGDGSNPIADHAVLWSKATFSGDVRIEYEFTVLDRYNTPLPPKRLLQRGVAIQQDVRDGTIEVGPRRLARGAAQRRHIRPNPE